MRKRRKAGALLRVSRSGAKGRYPACTVRMRAVSFKAAEGYPAAHVRLYVFPFLAEGGVSAQVFDPCVPIAELDPLVILIYFDDTPVSKGLSSSNILESSVPRRASTRSAAFLRISSRVPPSSSSSERMAPLTQ